MSNSNQCTQTAVERRSAEVIVQSFIARYSPDNQKLIDSVRRWMRKRLPSAHELVYEYRSWFVISYSPNGHGYEGVLAVCASEDGVKLYFNRAKELQDPEKLLRGSGKQTRWMHLDVASTLARREVASLIEEALAVNQVPFASTGRGPVVIRPTKQK